MSWLTIKTFKTWACISDTSKDNQIQQAVNAAVSEIEQYCQRKFALQTHQEFYTLAENQTSLALKNYPIISLEEISGTFSAAFSVQFSKSFYQSASLRVLPDKVILSLEEIGGSSIEPEFTYSEYPFLLNLAGEMQTEFGAIITWLSPDIAMLSSRRLLEWPLQKDALSEPAILEIGLPMKLNSIDIDAESGLLKFWERPAEKLRVRYQAGYASIPADLIQIACDLAKYYLDKIELNTLLQSESIGDYSYSYRTDKDSGFLVMPKDIQGRLNKWRRWIW